MKINAGKPAEISARFAGCDCVLREITSSMYGHPSAHHRDAGTTLRDSIVYICTLNYSAYDRGAGTT